MRVPKILRLLPVGVAALLAIPLRSDGGLPCDNVTTSLQSTLNNPIAGDEKFFTLPVGPSNVMFLLDVSGSMKNIPQCGDANAWGDGSALASCKWPTFASVSNPSVGGVNANGTCNVSGDLAWMTSYTPTTTLVDPGHGTATNGLVDAPPWGTGCVGSNCLFQPGQVYQYPGSGPYGSAYNWTETSALPVSDPCTVTFTYTDFDCGSKTNVTKTFTGSLPNCSACLTDAGAKGFYFYKNWTAAYTTNNTGGWPKSCTGSTTTNYRTGGGTATLLLSGGWLNANPPKFMSARKVIKDMAWIDPNVSANTDQLRLGLSYFSTSIGNGAAIIVPLGPGAADSYPVNPVAYVTARQTLLDALNHTHGGAAGWPTGITLPSLADGGTPMATGLFHVGQYFTTPGTYTSWFSSASYELSAFKETTPGRMNASWAGSSSTSFCWSCQKSAIVLVTDGSPNTEMTFPTKINSQQNNVYTLPTNCNAGTSCTTSPISKCCSPTDNSAPSKLPRIASFLHEKDNVPLVLNSDQLLAVSAISFNLPPGNAQTILQATANMGGGVYNNAADGTALAAAMAQAVAQVSNTATSFSAPAATALTTVNAVDTKAFITRFKPNQRATWEGHLYEWMLFDEAAAGCDPTKTAEQSASDPNQQVECRGRQVTANFDGAVNSAGFNICSKSFLVDSNCEEVVEDTSTGTWSKKGTGGQKAATFWDAGEVLSTPTVAGYRTAAEHRDNGNIAPIGSYASDDAKPRNLWTALPSGKMLELETKNAGDLRDYMNLDQTWCSQMESLAKLCGASPLPSCPVTVAGDWKTYCAQQVILFARGWDVLDQDADGCGGPGFGISPPSGYQPNPGNGTNNAVGRTYPGYPTAPANFCLRSATGNYTGEERDRQNDGLDTGATPKPTFWKLGDIFHSAPVLVHPPTPEGLCKNGLDNQCVRTLFGYTSNDKYTLQRGYQTVLEQYDGCKSAAGQVDAYRRWRADLAERKNVVLVGSNDGFLHAFDAGGPKKTSPSVQDLDCAWSAAEDGNGEELWAFLPPDLLPRLKDTMLNHQYMADGNIMVRDVWVDNAPADPSTNNPVSAADNKADGVKQRNEFRTIAVMTERAGGTQFTALDITNAFSSDASVRPRPTFRWSFPPPRSDDAQYMAQSWSDFAPRPPPIGPVRLAPASGEKATGKGKAPTGADESFVEKWVVMINGGYDPTLTRGRAVWMVDAWTGSVYWRFADPDFKKNVVGSAANTAVSMFPVPAGVGLVDIGNPTGDVGLDTDNFFDTGTWGDLGGNLFVARFDRPGTRDANGRVTNWKAARTFEQARSTSDAQSAVQRNEFYYMTANAFETQRHSLRTLLGAGNREQILEQNAGCGPDNLMSCCQAGCSVSSTSTLDYGVCSSTATFQCTSAGVMTTSPNLVQGCGAGGASACTGGASNEFLSTSTYVLNCGGTNTTTAAGTTKCDANGNCTVTPVGTGHDLTPPGAASCGAKARFYGIWAYGGANSSGTVTGKSMSTADDDWASAQEFDKNRFTDAPAFTKSPYCTFTPDHTCSLVDVTQAKVDSKGNLSCLSGSKCQASIDDPGWFYTYNTTCPTQVACSTGCTNEKTASGAAIVNNCVSWNSFIPKGSAVSGSDPCQNAQTAQQAAIGYASDYVSGAPTYACNQGIDAVDTNTTYRGAARTTIAPPAAPMARTSVTAGGRVYYSTLQLDPGSAANSTGAGVGNVASPLFWTEVSREAHMCRHVSGANCR
jgi:type IV pilus assembly protein PilY1